MSKSNSIEIIALLYLIAAFLANAYHHTRLLVWVLEFFTLENIIESMVWAVKEHKDTSLTTNTPQGKGL